MAIEQWGLAFSIPDILNDSEKSQVYFGLATLYRHMKDYDCSLRFHDKALHFDPNNISISSSKGCTLMAMGRHREALEWYDKFLERKPHSATVLNNKAYALAKNNRLGEASYFIDESLKIRPTSAAAFHTKGYILHKKGIR